MPEFDYLAALPVTTERLALHEYQESDWRSVHEFAKDPEVVRYLDWGPNSEEDTRDFIAHAIRHRQEQPRTRFEFAVTLLETGAIIGGCRLYVTSAYHREGEIGYVLNRQYWGQGYGSETARALLAFGFLPLDLHRIIAYCDPANEKSIRTLDRVGMTREGLLRERKWHKGEWRDSALYAILDHEWTRQAAERAQNL